MTSYDTLVTHIDRRRLRSLVRRLRASGRARRDHLAALADRLRRAAVVSPDAIPRGVVTLDSSREDDAATRRPPVPQTNPYSEELVKVIGVFHDPQAARQAKAELLAADLPVGGVRIEPVGLVQDLTPPSFYNPRGGLWDRLKHRLRGRPAPDRSTDDLSPDARVMVTVVPEAHARRVAAIQARHGALDAAPYLKWLPPRAPRGRRSARPRTPSRPRGA